LGKWKTDQYWGTRDLAVRRAWVWRLTAPQPYPIRTSTRPKGENHRRIRRVR
jgi:hypothetical protein